MSADSASPAAPAGVAGLALDDPRHGTANGYNNLNCHCERCKAAWAVTMQEAKERRAERLRHVPGLVPHGRASTYGNWKCRCEPCTTAWSTAGAVRQRRRRKAASLRKKEGVA